MAVTNAPVSTPMNRFVVSLHRIVFIPVAPRPSWASAICSMPKRKHSEPAKELHAHDEPVDPRLPADAARTGVAASQNSQTHCKNHSDPGALVGGAKAADAIMLIPLHWNCLTSMACECPSGLRPSFFGRAHRVRLVSFSLHPVLPDDRDGYRRQLHDAFGPWTRAADAAGRSVRGCPLRSCGRRFARRFPRPVLPECPD